LALIDLIRHAAVDHDVVEALAGKVLCPVEGGCLDTSGEMPWGAPIAEVGWTCTEGVTCSKRAIPTLQRVHTSHQCDSHRDSSMAKTNSRLIKHHAQSSPPFRRKFVTSSNTSKRVRQVFTASASSSSPVKQQSQLEEDLLDGGQPIIVDALDGTPPDVDYPADISVHTKAKRYQNSVGKCHYCIETNYI